MDEEREVRPGFLPPRAPGGGPPPRFQPPAAPPVQPPAAPQAPLQPQPPASDRPVFVTQRTESGPRSPLALTGTIVGAIGIVLLLLSVGFAFPVTIVLSLMAILFGVLARQQIVEKGTGRAGQARAAIYVGVIGLVLALVAWAALSITGFTAEELQRWLEDVERELEQQRERRRGGGDDVPA